jgi:tetratricopeptide (TPR) repeat protein
VTPAHPTSSRRRYWAVAAAVLAAVMAGIVLLAPFGRRGAGTLSEQDTILLADFMNTTGEPVFDGALKVALAVALEQSPFIKVFPDDRIRSVLRLMNRRPDERISREVAREIAQREHLKAFLTGSINSLGRNYVFAIEAVNAQTGDSMAREQVEVGQKEQVLAALGQAAARLRAKLGESLASIQKYDVPLPRATTSSLEALHSYALALDEDRLVARVGAIPHLKRAIELDPNFALAQALLSGVYANARQTALAPQYSSARSSCATGSASASASSSRGATTTMRRRTGTRRSSWRGRGRRRIRAKCSRSTASAPRYKAVAQFDQSIEAFRTSARLDPSFAVPVENLASTLIVVDRLDEAAAEIERATTCGPIS